MPRKVRRPKHSKKSKKQQPELPQELPALPILPSQNVSQSETIGSRLERVNNMDMGELQRLVEEGFQPDNIDLQEEIIQCTMRRLLKGREPRYQQVRSLRRLVYRLDDTMLIAKTGFGAITG
jgi:hypothetical protein